MTARLMRLVMAAKTGVDIQFVVHTLREGVILTESESEAVEVYGCTLATTVLRILAEHPERESILAEINDDTRANGANYAKEAAQV